MAYGAHRDPTRFDVTDFGARGDGVKDDTVAIQSAINEVDRRGGGTIFFPEGVYLIDGPFRQSPDIRDGYGIGQLILPTRNLSTQPPLSITLEGPYAPAPNLNWTNDRQPLFTNGAVLLSRKVADLAYYGIFNGGPPPDAVWAHSGIMARFRNLTFRTYDNPKITPLNLGNIGQAEVESVLIDTGTLLCDISRPTYQSLGIVLPIISNWAKVRLRDCDVIGYGYGYQWNEHAAVDDARAWLCNVGFQSTGAPHGCVIGKLLAVGCPTNLRFYGQPTKLLGPLLLDTEHTDLTGAREWTRTTVDIDDPNNLAVGHAYFCAVLSNVGTVPTMTIDGGANLTVNNVGAASVV